MAYDITFLAQHDGDLTFEDSGAGGTGTGTGALRYWDGHTAGVQAAIIERAGTNQFGNPDLESGGTARLSGIGGAGEATVSDYAYHGTYSYAANTALQSPGVNGTDSVVAHNIPATQGTVVSMSGWFRKLPGNGQHTIQLGFLERDSGHGGLGSDVWVDTFTLTDDWQLCSVTYTMQDASAAYVSGRMQSSGVEYRMDVLSIELADEPTTPIAGGLGTGYAWTGTVNDSDSTRAATEVAYTVAAPDWVACRYSEDFGATWALAYTETLAAENIGAHGSITHDGTDLVLASTGSTIFGPLVAGTGSLTSGEQGVLDDTATWTVGMSLEAPTAPTVDAGADETITTGDTLTRTVSFTDPNADTWTATVDYGEGAGAVAVTVDQGAKTVALSHTYSTAGAYTVTVVVSDGTTTGQDTFIVTVNEVGGVIIPNNAYRAAILHAGGWI